MMTYNFRWQFEIRTKKKFFVLKQFYFEEYPFFGDPEKKL